MVSGDTTVVSGGTTVVIGGTAVVSGGHHSGEWGVLQW